MIIVPIYKKSDKIDCTNYGGILLLSTTYKILSNILLSRLLHIQRKLLGIINVDFDATGQLLIIYPAFIIYLRKNENTIIRYTSYIQTARKPMFQLGGSTCINILIEFCIPMKLVRLIKYV